MPKIQWTDLPPALRDHLFERDCANAKLQPKTQGPSGASGSASRHNGTKTLGHSKSAVRGISENFPTSWPARQGREAVSVSRTVLERLPLPRCPTFDLFEFFFDRFRESNFAAGCRRRHRETKLACTLHIMVWATCHTLTRRESAALLRLCGHWSRLPATGHPAYFHLSII